MSNIFDSVANEPGLLIPIIAVGGGLLVAIVAISFEAIRRMLLAEEQEKSRREIAAYIAEGSMTPEEGVQLMKASPGDRKC
tara:strand:- start:68338 stop:68580 length:243 start_codon:yes stop_codon:yes gene_type:complete